MLSIPKPKGGDRAIGVTSTVYGAVNGNTLAEWRSAKAGFWDTAIGGSSSLRAAIRRVMQAEVAVAAGDEVISALSDF